MNSAEIRAGIIGRGASFASPFGTRRLVYCDWTASSRAHRMVEEVIARDVLPLYGNTHDTHSICGRQSTCFREEARQIVAQATNAKVATGDNEGGASKDVVIFTGAGATGASNALVHILGVKERARGAVVLVGPFEHHSNIIPWRESGARIVRIAEAKDGRVDRVDLERALREARDAAAPLVIGAFCAASNVTGVLSDVDAITALLHAHGALAVWDYATAGPYVPIDMNPARGDGRFAKDAVFFSPHKFLGGVNSPGVLVLKKKLCRNAVPRQPGGGTVFFVTEHAHRFLSNRMEREEGGTPDIVGTVRAGLAMHLLRCADPRGELRAEELAITQRVHARLRAAPGLVVLGPSPARVARLPIFSFLVRVGRPDSDVFLHHNFVTRILNDVFGIQARGGCACAGPYAQTLLGMTRADPNAAAAGAGEGRAMDARFTGAFEAALLAKNELLRPGFTRLSLPWLLSEKEVEYVCAALALVARDGWRLLPVYQFNHANGEWFHKKSLNKFPARKWLSSALKSLRHGISGGGGGAAAATAAATAATAATEAAALEADASEAEVLAAQLASGARLLRGAALRRHERRRSTNGAVRFFCLPLHFT